MQTLTSFKTQRFLTGLGGLLAGISVDWVAGSLQKYTENSSQIYSYHNSANIDSPTSPPAVKSGIRGDKTGKSQVKA